VSKTNTYQLFLTDTHTAAGSLHRSRGVAASSTNTYYGAKMKPTDAGLLGFQLETTGNLTGTFTLWYSDEEKPALDTDTDWVQDTSWVRTNPAAGTTKVKYAGSGLKGRWARVKYVNASGTGNLLGVVAS
jgi:hypothetical protein